MLLNYCNHAKKPVTNKPANVWKLNGSSTCAKKNNFASTICAIPLYNYKTTLPIIITITATGV